MKRPILFALTLAAAAMLFDGEALARRGGRDETRVRERVTLVASGFPGRARLEIRRDAADRQEIRLNAEMTNAGEDVRVWIENADAQMAEVATMRETRAGRYTWRVRTKKGDALPFGQSDLSGLSGRTVEIRTADGAVAFEAAFPVVGAAKAPVATKKAIRTNLAVNRDVAAAIGAPGFAARTEVSLRRSGRQRFGVKIENALPGQTFEVWVQDPATGEMVFLSTITTGSGPAMKRGGDDGPDGEDDPDEIEGDEDEGEVELDTEDGDDLPVGATTVSELAGLDVEVRTESGDVVAEGEIAAVGAAPRADDDDEDGVEDGEDADDEDEDEDADDDADDETDEPDTDDDGDDGDDGDDDAPAPVLKR